MNATHPWKPDHWHDAGCTANGHPGDVGGAPCSRCQIDAMEADLARVTEERDAWKLKAQGQDGLLVAYRTGRSPSEATFKKLERARKALESAAPPAP